MLQGVVFNASHRAFTEEDEIELPRSAFKAHSRFLILALSLLIDIGVLHIDIETYTAVPARELEGSIPLNPYGLRFDRFVPYDIRVCGFQSLEHRYKVPLSDINY